MLIYEKWIEDEQTGEKVRFLFQAVENDIPSEDDPQLSYTNEEQQELFPYVDLLPTDTYLDDGQGGIIQKSTGDEVIVYGVGGKQIIPPHMIPTEVEVYDYNSDYIVGQTFEAPILRATGLDGEKVYLTYGVDYTTEPANGAVLTEVNPDWNDPFMCAFTLLGKYSNFEVDSVEYVVYPEIDSLVLDGNTTYSVGDTLEDDGNITLTLTFKDSAYTEEVDLEDATFTPALDKALSATDTSVVANYTYWVDNKTNLTSNTLTITVS